ncbi:MAG TPA: hypothetical protein VD713_06170 [Sphingomonadales bacterium]|nr:hypothetical protein [Sphingomonadales bacterium]
MENGDINQPVENQVLPAVVCGGAKAVVEKSKFSGVKKQVTGLPQRHPRLRGAPDCDAARLPIRAGSFSI